MPIRLQLWIAAVRKCLSDIYGNNSQYLNAFPTFPPTSRRSPIPGLKPVYKPTDVDVPAIFAERMEQLNRIIEHLETLGSSPAKPVREKLMLKCFFSYRFADENEITALRIQEFLKLLDVEVLTGNRYEPRRISEKSQVQEVVAVCEDFLCRQGAGLCRHRDIRYDATSRKTCRRGVSWR